MAALLTPKLLLALERLELVAARRAQSSAKGERSSRSRGQSVEFADYRNYVQGDDFRYLDWNLYGRLEKLFLKLYQEEKELPVRIFLDASESMSFGEPAKFDFARRLAAAVGHVALCGFDRVSVAAFPGLGDAPEERAARASLRHVRGKRSAAGFLSHLEALKPAGAAELNAALKRAAFEARGAGMAMVLSDFLDPVGYEDGLGALVARKFQVNVIQVLSPEEIAPSFHGDLRLVDSETGAIQEVTFGKSRLKAYQQTLSKFIGRLRDYCAARGMKFFSVSSAAPIEDFLLKDLRKGRVWE